MRLISHLVHPGNANSSYDTNAYLPAIRKLIAPSILAAILYRLISSQYGTSHGYS